MKICVYTNHFFPEDFKVNDIAFELQKRGHDITVITALPDYPKRSMYRDYTIFKRNNETVNGVHVYRLPAIPRSTGNKIALILNYISYFLSVSIFTFFFKYTQRFDAVFVHHTSPFFMSLAAVSLKKKQRIPLVFWCLDLWPESLTAAAGIKSSIILRPQIAMVQHVYNQSDKILIGSRGFEQSICEKGDYKDKLVYFPNWAEYSASTLHEPSADTLAAFPKFSKEDFVILFAGNIGASQNIECIVSAASKLKKTDKVKFVFLGDGRQRKQLIDETMRLDLNDIIFFPGRYPIETMPFFMNRADVLLVSLKDEPIFNLTVPSKVQFYMAQGKPILAMLNGDGRNLINEAQCGIAVPANDTDAFLCAIKKLRSLNTEELKEMGIRGEQYSKMNFKKEQRMDQLSEIFTIVTDTIKEEKR